MKIRKNTKLTIKKITIVNLEMSAFKGGRPAANSPKCAYSAWETCEEAN
ncbi:MAG: hypothetical protein GY765_11485 [bacterium]|nr:hypothetical protein [bacterium]